MVLVLAVHTVKEVSATVPFSTILLQDIVVHKKAPAEHKCRQLIPTSGSTSTSLWDTPDPAALLAWLEGAVAVDVAHSVHEVQEEFALGLGDVARARGADVVAAAGRDVADTTGRAVLDLDARLHLSEKAGRAADAVRDSAVTKSTVAALNKAGTRVADVTTRVLESDRVAAATDAMGAGFKKLGASFTRFVRPGEPAAAAGAGGDAPLSGDMATQPATKPPTHFSLNEVDDPRHP
ncbi:hypothetical protein F751_3312 [Auxenochlorella protothecoides]|uniref:Uncharacterized protein n=1 Tax=Auxenochlorella protothecoides TaxID=3075 RepID=A0A087SBL7_AUXPR|nr:hypothetical protein F751_3312 [Auxenochlorella protothecoides]KFM23121.1 hypothetical protein F751_3312 [Auxenochlorella protothecoides]RMZ55076.1 hypothetical protein APUTEX25_005702 [Auxenochlorella protothecoides]|eukprot:RMZ55076.1 hypothetical protein APUTEX25_005702 [Auxenochlorella protothecoides]